MTDLEKEIQRLRDENAELREQVRNVSEQLKCARGQHNWEITSYSYHKTNFTRVYGEKGRCSWCEAETILSRFKD